MTPAPARLGLLFALTLLLPASFAGAWIWLQHGGLIANARDGERRAADQALAYGARTLHEGLLAAAATAPVVLRLDAERRVIAPFAAQRVVPATDEATISIAEQAAGARLATGDRAGALPFFEHAAAVQSLSPEGWLRYVDTLAATDVAAARRTLATAEATLNGVRCGALPFELLAALRELAWPGILSSTRTERLTQLLRAAERVPAEAFEAVAPELLAAVPDLADDDRLHALRAAAAVALRHRNTPTSAIPAPGPHGSVLQPLDDERLAVLPANTVTRHHEAAIAAAARMHPGIAIERTTTPDTDTTSLEVPALAATWCARNAVTTTSTLLTIGARTSLVLAILTFVFGNLLLWRLTRRELALVRLRADFVDVVSHELRTPLTALSLKSEMLAAGDVPRERFEHYLQGLHQDVRRLAGQVERILDFGRLEKGAPLLRQAVPARAVLARGLRAGRPALRLVAQQLEIDAARELPTIVGDVEVLSRALRNLLENAAKYAPPGSTVAVRAFTSGRELVVEVADRGPGVPATERRSIFQPFVRGSAAAPAMPGSGLGLALVAAAARVHGGSVDVREREGGGAVFTLHLPIGAEHAS